MRKIFVLSVLLFSAAPIFSQIVIREVDSLKRHYTSKAQTMLVADSSLFDYIVIDLNGVSIYSSKENRLGNVVESQVFWSELAICKRVLREESRENAMTIMLAKGAKMFGPAIQKQYSHKPNPKIVNEVAGKKLSGYRIALDPGHIAHDTAMGRIEQKFISMFVPIKDDSMHVGFAEGQLTWQTAVALAARLRNEGAEVFITRADSNITAFGKTFEAWKREDFPRTLDSLIRAESENAIFKDLKSGKLHGDRAIFRFVFRDVELRKRADIINAFNPDLTVVIHYNVDESNSPWVHPTKKDFCMVFVPGAFQSSELGESENRFDFLRLLLLDDVETSIAIGGKIAEQLVKKLKVSPATTDDAGYLLTSCRKTKKVGVFARNLSMTRLVHGPVVFGETLYQDNYSEALSLSQMSLIDKVSGQRTSVRIVQAAEAYCEGIVQWAVAEKLKK